MAAKNSSLLSLKSSLIEVLYKVIRSNYLGPVYIPLIIKTLFIPLTERELLGKKYVILNVTI